MIGNDIVDIAEAKQKSNWQRPRFLEKLFTSHEQRLIQNSDNSFLMVWRLWSMKEAAYKLYTQLQPSRFYNPKQFECEINDSEGKVSYKDFSCYIKTKMTSQYIISEARLNHSKMTSKVIEFKENGQENQSEKIKDALLSELSNLYRVSKTGLKFEKSEFGIPTVIFNSDNIEVSLSHHGCFGTYVVS